MQHALSVDVEDWYHDSGDDPADVGERVEHNTDRLLECFAAIEAHATFFVLGEVAARYPALVRRIAAAGHEIASHSFRHRRVLDLTQREFRDDVRRSKAVIEDVVGAAIAGFRAPYFSIKAGVRWPIDILAECGFGYDASVLSIDRPPGLDLVAPRRPYRLHNGLWEIPVALLQLGPFWHLPLASGAGLRVLSVGGVLRRVQRFAREHGPAVFYLHPWEIDPGSPTAPGAGRWWLRVGRARLEGRLRELGGRVSFGALREVFHEEIGERG